MREKGIVIVFTGDGKGKTTAALGVALRASGHNMKTFMIEFLKGQIDSGEQAAHLSIGLEIYSFGGGFIFEGDDINPHREIAQKGWSFMEEKVRQGGYDVLVLDEVAAAINLGLIDTCTVAGFLDRRDSSLHVILTGRDMPHKLLEMAQVITEMREIKHAYHEGVMALKGLDY